jgi:DNA primase
MAFPDSFVDEVRRTADIVRLISDHVGLRKVGGSWKGLCPFHQEKTPSFNVRSEPPLFHCFGCGEGGDVFKFVMLRERVSFPEAIEIVARRFGVPVPERSFEPGPDRKAREELLAVLEAAAEHFSRNLWTAPGRHAREYLLGRGFKKETLERIRAGAAPDGWGDLLDALRRRYAPTVLVNAGLVVERQDRSGHYDRFRNRAVFPIFNESGKVVAFGARSLDGSEPKYLNSPETAAYQKSRTLYGLSWAKEAIRREGRVVLMEGYLDVARALEAGVEEAVATCGTALTGSHARLLRRFSERVVVNFDQDAAGQKAARKSIEILLGEAEELKVQVVALPEGHDPDSYLKAHGAEAYRQRLGEAPDAMEWLIARAAAENDVTTPSGKAAYLNALLPALLRIQSAVERAAWLPRIAERGGLDPRATEVELRRAAASRTAVRPEAVAPAPSRPERPTLLPAERWLLALIVKESPGLDEALAELSDHDLDGLASAEVLRAARALYLRGVRVTAAGLAAELANEESRALVTEMAVSPVPTGRVSPLDCVREIQCWPLEARIAEIQKQVARVESDERLNALLEEQLRLKQKIASLSRPALRDAKNATMTR